MRTNVRKRVTKHIDQVVLRRTSTISLVTHASNKDTIHINAQRKVLQDLSELG
jgi:hypothetical protein